MGRKAKYATQATFQPYIDAIAKDLGIDLTIVEFRFTTFRSKYGDINYGQYYTLIRIDKRFYGSRGKREVLRTIMHEMRHLWQYQNNHLQRSGYEKGKYYSLWMGQRYEDFSGKASSTKYHKAYLDSPWEVDARDYADKVDTLFPNMQLPETCKYIGTAGNVKFYKKVG